jgi:uncharacterized protein (DUF305 family)
MTRTTGRVVAALAALAAAVALSSCSGSSSSGGQTNHATSAQNTESSVRVLPAAIHNADDVSFAQKMIPHHQQAVDMAAMVRVNTGNPDVIALASHIKADQQPEIQAFTAWLVQWGQEVPPPGGHAGHAGMGMDGMVDPATMNKLQSLKGADFDTLWMQAMIGHHQGAVTMSQAEIAHGQNPDVISMAKLIVTAQQKEIDYMKHLLGKTE